VSNEFSIKVIIRGKQDGFDEGSKTGEVDGELEVEILTPRVCFAIDFAKNAPQPIFIKWYPVTDSGQCRRGSVGKPPSSNQDDNSVGDC